MLLRVLLLLAAFAAALSPAQLAAQSAVQLDKTHVEILARSATVKPGSALTIGLVFTPKPGWHTYWEHPGDSGMAIRADWSFPTLSTPDPNRLVGPLRYPVPETYIVSGLMNHVYSSRHVVLGDIQVPQDIKGEFAIRVRLDWLVCDDKLCVPEGADLSLNLPLGDGAQDNARKADFEAAEAALPRPLAEKATWQIENGRFRLSVPFAAPQSVQSAHYFAAVDDAVLFAAPQSVSLGDNALIIETDAVPGTDPQKVAGLLRVETANGVQGFTFEGEKGLVDAGSKLLSGSQNDASNTAAAAFWPALGLAILGGLLLNLMPCVFPILSLKAMSLAKAGHSQAAARREGLAYTAGVMLLTTALGLVAIILAQAGQGAGWAFQLQDPRVILFLALLSFAIALNFTGLFEVHLGSANSGNQLANQPGAKGAFFTGALAAFVATPCTGPFMAGALGAALVLPPLAGLAVFAGLGLGLALPFLLIGFVPALRKWLPKPGNWMVTFRHILSVPMFLTSIGLLWVLGRQIGVDGVMLGLMATLVFAIALWVMGMRQKHFRSARLPLALALGVLLVAPIALPHLIDQTSRSQIETADLGPKALQAVSYTPEALQKALAAKQPTFLYFTADWCLTCKVNEKGALADPAVAEAFKAKDIQVMVGDWTRPDPAIAQFLKAQGRAGIPLYLFYDATGTQTELPQLLTVDSLLALESRR